MYIIAVFTNRTDTLYFHQILKQNKIPSSVINTPNRAQFSCSISVKMPKAYYNIAYTLISKYNLTSFSRFIYI